MATNFPTSLDTFTNPNSGNTLDSPSHSLQHADINDAVEAIEAKIGVGSSTAGSATEGYALVNTSGGTTAYSLLGVAGLSSGTAPIDTFLRSDGAGAATFASLPTSDTPGMVFLSTDTFSGVSFYQLPTDTFTTTYDNYKIIITNVNVASGAEALRMRFSTNGTPNTSSSYNYGGFNMTRTGTSSAASGSDQSNIFISELSTGTTIAMIDLDVFSPKLSQKITCNFHGWNNNSFRMQIGSGHFNETTSFTELRIFPDNGTMSGTISVYGVNK